MVDWLHLQSKRRVDKIRIDDDGRGNAGRQHPHIYRQHPVWLMEVFQLRAGFGTIMAGVALPHYLRFDDWVRGLYMVTAKRSCFSRGYVRVCESTCGSAARQLARARGTHGADSCSGGNHYRVGGIYQ